MKRISWEIKFGALLVLIAFGINAIHYAIFRDINHIFLWTMTNLGFLPISVLVVVLIVDRLLARRDRGVLLSKLNMLIGTFFSEVGAKAIEYFSSLDSDPAQIREDLSGIEQLDRKSFVKIKKMLQGHHFEIIVNRQDIEALRIFFMEKRDFLVRLLENQNLLEHESFAETLRALFHLTEELTVRKDVKVFSENDLKHIANDVKRAYRLIVFEWFDYIMYLKENYPYLFSFTVRTNPFDKNSSITIK